MRGWLATIGLIVGTIFLSACATVPEEIAKPPKDNPTVKQVRADPNRYVGQDVRWGGNIVEVHNDEEETYIEIIARDLHRDGRPGSSDLSPGRFIAIFDQFLDPEIYYEGRAITVVGTLEGERIGKIGERDYKYPVVRVTHHLLWRAMERDYYSPRYRSYYDDPFYPWGPYYYPSPFYYPYPHSSIPRKPHILRD